MKDSTTTLESLKTVMAIFVQERDWQQFHNPKSIVMALAVEVGELMERFSWPTTQESYATMEEYREHIEQEVADVFSLLLAFANATHIDIATAFESKMKLNRKKYPVDVAKGIHDRNKMNR